MNKKFFIVLAVCLMLINAITLFFPLEMYDGEVLYNSGLTEKQTLSLSYLVNKVEFLKNYPNVKDIYLNTIGWVLVVCINFALPLMVAVRSITKKKKNAIK